jgi:hypothetical protein
MPLLLLLLLLLLASSMLDACACSYRVCVRCPRHAATPAGGLSACSSSHGLVQVHRPPAKAAAGGPAMVVTCRVAMVFWKV